MTCRMQWTEVNTSAPPQGVFGYSLLSDISAVDNEPLDRAVGTKIWVVADFIKRLSRAKKT
jgi:hypothetical protein